MGAAIIAVTTQATYVFKRHTLFKAYTPIYISEYIFVRQYYHGCMRFASYFPKSLRGNCMASSPWMI